MRVEVILLLLSSRVFGVLPSSVAADSSCDFESDEALSRLKERHEELSQAVSLVERLRAVKGIQQHGVITILHPTNSMDQVMLGGRLSAWVAANSEDVRDSLEASLRNFVHLRDSRQVSELLDAAEVSLRQEVSGIEFQQLEQARVCSSEKKDQLEVHLFDSRLDHNMNMVDLDQHVKKFAGVHKGLMAIKLACHNSPPKEVQSRFIAENDFVEYKETLREILDGLSHARTQGEIADGLKGTFKFLRDLKKKFSNSTIWCICKEAYETQVDATSLYKKMKESENVVKLLESDLIVHKAELMRLKAALALVEAEKTRLDELVLDLTFPAWETPF